MVHRIRVLLLIPHLGGGGAERVTALLVRGLSRQKYELHLGIITQQNLVCGDLFEGVKVHALGAKRVRACAWRLLRLVRRLRPGVILSGMFHLNFLVLLLRPLFPAGTRVLVRQNGTVSAALAAGGLPGSARLLYRALYRHADRVICSSQAMATDLISTIGLAPELAVILPNPVEDDRILAARHGPVHWARPGPNLLAVGRLAPEKGFDILLQAFAAVLAHFPAANLVIAGEGKEDSALLRECRRLDLQHAVTFAGHVEDPSVFFPGATLFVLSSRHEGMPNSLLEALAGRVPLVAFPASGGVVDLLRGRRHAWMAPRISADALADTLLEALGSLASRSPLHPSGVTMAMEDTPALPAEFSFARAIGAYEALIDSLPAERRI